MTSWPRPINPDCKAGKHGSCFRDAWDFENDCAAPCECGCHTERKTA